MKEKGFLSEIHLFRGFAIVIIASSHLLYVDQTSLFFRSVSAIYLNSTLFFVFISGFLFQYLSSRFQYLPYLKRKFKFVILPYLVISIPALLLRLFGGASYMALRNWPEIEMQSKLTQILYYLGTGSHLIPLWYIPVIAVFFLASPVLKAIDEHPKLYWLLIPLFVLSMICYRDPFNINNIPRMVAHFASVYVFGMCYCRYRESIEGFVRKWSAGILAFFLITFLYSLSGTATLYYQAIFIGKILAILLLLHLFKRIKQENLKRGLSELATSSFGIYFIHFYIILALRKLSVRFLGSEYPDAPLYWFLTLLITMIMSWMIVAIARRLLGKKSRLILGS